MEDSAILSNNKYGSRSDIVKSAIGTYLKKRNYLTNDSFRKSDHTITQTSSQIGLHFLLEDCLSKPNEFLYSNAISLRNNHNEVDQQFSKFFQYTQKHSESVKIELHNILCSLLGHLYIQLLKGKDHRAALDFLNKFAHIVAPIQSLNKSKEDENITLSTATQRIKYLDNSSSDENKSQNFFKELIESMSNCLRTEDLDKFDIIKNFRYSKFKVDLSLKAVYVLKAYFLKENGHLLIQHIFRTAFSIEIVDENCDNDVMMNTEGNIENFEFDANRASSSSSSSSSSAAAPAASSSSSSSPAIQNTSEFPIKTQTITRSSLALPSLIFKSTNNNHSIENNEKSNNFFSIVKLMKQRRAISDKSYETIRTLKNQKLKTSNVMKNSYLDKLKDTLSKLDDNECNLQVFKITNCNSTVCAGDLDLNNCHLACGLANSVIKMWSIDQKSLSNRRPYGNYMGKSCTWQQQQDDLNLNQSLTNEDDMLSNNDRKTHSLFKNSNVNEISALLNPCYTLTGHSKSITDVLFSLNNPVLMSVSQDRTMRIWNTSQSSCSKVYRGHSNCIWCVAESPFHLYVATGSKDLTARIWSTEREYPLQTYIGHTHDITAISFHPSGSYFATGSTDCSVRLWCVTTGKLLRIFTDCHLPVQCVEFSSDGKFLAVSGEESKIRIFDLAAGTQISELRDHTGPISNISWHNSGMKLASSYEADSSIVRILNTDKFGAQEVKEPDQFSAFTGACRPSGSTYRSPISFDSNCRKLLKLVFNPSHPYLSCIGRD